jgi:phasin family protein
MSTLNTKAAKPRASKTTSAFDAHPFKSVPFKSADEVAEFGKSNVEALIAAGTNFLRGWEELTKSVVGLTQAQVETSISTVTAALGAKSLGELNELHKTYTKAAFDNAVSEASRLSELAIRIASETAEPLNARVTAAVEHFSKPALAA